MAVLADVGEAGGSGRVWMVMYSAMIDNGAAPADATKRDGDQKWLPHKYLPFYMFGKLLPQVGGG